MVGISEIFKLLDNDPALEAVVGNRIYLSNYPTNSGDVNSRPIAPYIIVEEISSIPHNTAKGAVVADKVVVQIDILADTYREIKHVRALVREVLCTKGYEIETGSNWESEPRLYRETMEWSFHLPR